VAFNGLFPPASSTCAIAFVNISVFFGILMPTWAMSFSFVFRSISFSTKSKAGSIIKLFSRNNLIIAKSFFDSCDNRVSFNTGYFSEVERPVFNTINSDKSRHSSIKLLLASSSPSAVIWRVISVVIFSIQCIIIRSVAHIRDKLMKITNPFITYGNSSAAIIMVMRIIRVITSGFHRLPAAIKRVWIFERHNNTLLNKDLIIPVMRSNGKENLNAL